MNRKKTLQVAVPAIIALIIAALWIFRNYPDFVLADTASKTVANRAAPKTSDKGFSATIPLNLTLVDLENIKDRGLPAIIDFGADACVPCKEMAPVLIKLNTEMQQKASIHFVDVWKYPGAARGFPVQVIPTQIFINADGSPYKPSETLDVPFTLYANRESNEHVFTAHQGGLDEEQMRAILSDMGAL